MPEHSKNDSEIFEIERIGNSDLSDNCEKPSRSLVFKISKKIFKNASNQEVDHLLNSYESKEKENTEKSNPDKENNSSDPIDTTEDLKVREAKPVTDVMENVQLRRSSRRVTVRIKEDLSPDQRVIKRKKRCGKMHKGIQGKKKPGRRGRPRKNPNLQLSSLTENSSLSWIPKQSRECSNFCSPGKNHLWEQNNTRLSQETENVFHSLQTNVRFKGVDEKQDLPRSSRQPTIIYFKCPKNRQTLSVPGISKQLHSPHYIPFSPQEYSNFIHLRKKYSIINEAILHQFYNESKRDIARTETMLQDLLVREIKLLSGHPIIEQPSPVAKVDRTNTSCNSTQHLESDVIVKGHYIKTDEVDTLYRQVIIDSIKLLYDEQSVTGYS